MKTVQYKVVLFKGIYTKLKEIGFKFSRMYAGNYMQWSYRNCEFGNVIRVYKRGAELILSDQVNYTGYIVDEIIKHHLDSIPVVMSKDGCAVVYAFNKETSCVSLLKRDVDTVSEYSAFMNGAILSNYELFEHLSENKQIETREIDMWVVEMIVDFYKRGWIEVSNCMIYA